MYYINMHECIKSKCVNKKMRMRFIGFPNKAYPPFMCLTFKQVTKPG